MNIPADRYIYRVTDVRPEALGVKTLTLEREGGALSYIPGQFLTVYLPELDTPEGKAYSISSAPEEPLSITVSERGEFSRRLCSLQPGDTLLASAPSGYFYSESGTSTLVLLAAGIGIAPFRSVMLDAARKNPRRPMQLFYSSRTMSHVVFGDALEQLVTSYEHVGVHHFITRQEFLPAGVSLGRLTARAVMLAVRHLEDPEFFICGSIPFVRDLWRDLRDQGVSEDVLYTEAFFSH